MTILESAKELKGEAGEREARGREHPLESAKELKVKIFLHQLNQPIPNYLESAKELKGLEFECD